MVGVVVRTYGWIILLGSEGIVNKFLLGIGIIDSPVGILYTEGAVIIGIVEILLPFMVLPLMSSIQKIDISQEEAARVLGATRITTFYKVILPLSVPGMISGSLLVLTLSISALSTPLFLGGPKNIMIAVLIWQQMLTVRNWPFGSAMAIILMVVTSAIIMFYLKAIRVKTTRG
jgi:putative spermidine/putrescine transport system permease protein